MAERLRDSNGRFVGRDLVAEEFLDRYRGADGKLNIPSQQEMDDARGVWMIENYQHMQEVAAAQADYLNSTRNVRFIG